MKRIFYVLLLLTTFSLHITAEEHGQASFDAIARKDVQELRRLLVDNNLEVRDKAGNTLLHQAILTGNHEIIDMLLQMGVNVHAKNALEQTGLHYAAHKRDNAVISKLIVRGGDVNARDCEAKYSTALCCASWCL